jgi:hypothetical protein
MHECGQGVPFMSLNMREISGSGEVQASHDMVAAS